MTMQCYKEVCIFSNATTTLGTSNTTSCNIYYHQYTNYSIIITSLKEFIQPIYASKLHIRYLCMMAQEFQENHFIWHCNIALRNWTGFNLINYVLEFHYESFQYWNYESFNVWTKHPKSFVNELMTIIFSCTSRSYVP